MSESTEQQQPTNGAAPHVPVQPAKARPQRVRRSPAGSIETRVLEFLGTHDKATVPTICAAMKIAKTSAWNQIRRMADKGLIRRVGSDSGTALYALAGRAKTASTPQAKAPASANAKAPAPTKAAHVLRAAETWRPRTENKVSALVTVVERLGELNGTIKALVAEQAELEAEKRELMADLQSAAS